MAERNLAAATARIGAAEAARYPSLSLSGTLGLQSNTVSGLDASDADAWSWAGQLAAPLFDGGRLRQQVEIRNAQQEQALAAYEATVLGALEETENALAAFAGTQRQQAALSAAVEGARNAAMLARVQYESGLIDFATLLVAERTQLVTESSLAVASADRAGAIVRLYKALGGGWSHEQPVEPGNEHTMTKATGGPDELAQILSSAPHGHGRRRLLAPSAPGSRCSPARCCGSHGDGKSAVEYRTEAVRRGDLVVTVSATGNLQPTNQVDVGSELSGTIEAVSWTTTTASQKGQVLARLDIAKLQNQLTQSRAALASAEAQVLQAQATVDGGAREPGAPAPGRRALGRQGAVAGRARQRRGDAERAEAARRARGPR